MEWLALGRVLFDVLRVKIRSGRLVSNKAVYLALGIQADGQRDVLGLWIEQTEGAKFWLKVFNGTDLHRASDPQQPGLRQL